jgi:hypothetical protein
LARQSSRALRPISSRLVVEDSCWRIFCRAILALRRSSSRLSLRAGSGFPWPASRKERTTIRGCFSTSRKWAIRTPGGARHRM